jgi:hypothetical protein
MGASTSRSEQGELSPKPALVAVTEPAQKDLISPLC